MFDSPSAAANSLRDAAPDRAALRLAVLDELTALGLELARAITGAAVARAEAGASAAENASASLALSRIAKTVRLNLALEDRLGRAQDRKSEGGESPNSDQDAAAAEDATWVRRTLWSLANRKSLHLAVERAIATDASDRDPDRLRAEMNEQLVEVEDLFDCDHAGLAERVRQVCGALDLTPDESVWGDDGGDLGADAADAAWMAARRHPPPKRH